jgi:TolB-like protein
MGTHAVPRFAAQLLLLALAVTGCTAPARYVRPNADLGLISTVAVLPFENVTSDRLSAERVHKIFYTELLSFDAFQVLEPGQVGRALRRDQLDPATLTPEELKKLGEALKVQAFFLGSILEYDEGRTTGTAQSPTVKLQLKLVDAESGTTLWSVVRGAGGATVTARLFGIGGEPASTVASQIIREELARLLR